jgi:hypothetical protein
LPCSTAVVCARLGRNQTPQQFVETIQSDLDRWGPVVKASSFVAVD